MNPETIKALQESPHFKELVDYLAMEAVKLNRTDDIDTKNPPNVVALQVAARKEAFETIAKILDPLMDLRKYDTMFSGKDYAVEVP